MKWTQDLYGECRIIVGRGRHVTKRWCTRVEKLIGDLWALPGHGHGFGFFLASGVPNYGPLARSLTIGVLTYLLYTLCMPF